MTRAPAALEEARREEVEDRILLLGCGSEEGSYGWCAHDCFCIDCELAHSCGR